jgi:hypothetical protein
MFLFSLIAALAGTPLRLAEAASDLCSFLAELDGGPEIEVPDGGVGDDSGATLKADVLRISAHGNASPIAPAGDLLAPVISKPSFDWREDLPPRRTGTVPEHLAHLQCFLC